METPDPYLGQPRSEELSNEGAEPSMGTGD